MSTTELSSHVLVRTLEQLSTARTVEQVARVVSVAVRALMGADGATFVLREDDRCFYADEDAIGPLWKGQRFPASACVSGWVMAHGETVTIPDVRVDERVPQDAYKATFVRSMVMVPVRPEAPVGALGAYWRDRREPDAGQVRQLEVLATSVAVALENLELRGEVSRRQDERDELETAIHSMVHDLRNPLVAMTGYAELITDELPRDPELAAQLAHTIVRAGHRASAQLDRMLALYRVVNAPLLPEPVDLSEVARAAAAAHLVTSRERAMSIEVEDGLNVVADRLLVELAVANLLDNAVKYTSRKPEALIEVARVAGPSAMTTFVVRDNGEGFDPDDAHRLFRPLARLHTSEHFPGTGLGLASVARIVASHGGRVRAEGVPQEGASFFVSLPAPA